METLNESNHLVVVVKFNISQFLLLKYHHSKKRIYCLTSHKMVILINYSRNIIEENAPEQQVITQKSILFLEITTKYILTQSTKAQVKKH